MSVTAPPIPTTPSADRNKALADLIAGRYPDARGRYGPFGGRFVPETLMGAIERVEREFRAALADPAFMTQLAAESRRWIGRATPLCPALRLGEQWGGEVWLKREDLAHTGAHKINNALGQAMLAKRMGVRRIIAETGAGQHGVATAAACARLGIPCRIYMGEVDAERQRPNVLRMQRFGAEVVPVTTGDRTLRAAIDEALRDWVGDPIGTHYLIGSAVGPHPFPWIVRTFQSVIGREAREQMLAPPPDGPGRLPDAVFACVGGGSNAIGMFHAFLADASVALIGVEAGGRGSDLGDHAATLARGRPGVLHGAYSLLLQDEHGQVHETHSVSAGLDYPGVGPEHAFLASIGRLRSGPISDADAIAALDECCRFEGILPAVESAHALAGAKRWLQDHPGSCVLVNLSGRGDKDMPILERLFDGGDSR